MSRYYLTSRAPGVFFRGRFQGGWHSSGSSDRHHGDRQWTWMLHPSKNDGGRVHQWSAVERSDLDPYDVTWGRWITHTLEAQSIGGTLNIAVGCQRSNFAATVKWRLFVYICVGDTNAVRHVLLDYVDSVDLPSTSSPQVRALAAPVALTSGNALAGDRIILELGTRCSPNPGPVDGITIFDTAMSIWFGPRSSGDAALPDAIPGSATPANWASYVQFSQDIAEQAPPPTPSNCTCLTAKQIPSLPYQEVVDTTTSTDVDKRVWYRFVPPSTARVCVSVLGSNYDVLPRITTNGCAIQTGIIADLGDTTVGQWIYNTTTFQSWIAQAGKEYMIHFFTDPGEDDTARRGGGCLDFRVFYTSTVQADDVVLNSFHTAVVRGTEIVHLTDRWALFVPTGVSIDDTHRPIWDLPLNAPHTDRRLAVTVFDSSQGQQRVEFLDLATLNDNRGSSAWMYIGMISDGAETAGVQPASIVWDLQGNYYVGFFGDNYDHNGEVPTNPATAWVRKFRGNGVSTAEYPPITPPAEQLGEYQVEFENSGSDYIDLASDQRTLFYTSAGRRILRFDTVTQTQLPDFAVLPVEVKIRPGLRGLRLLPPGDGTGGLVVADGDHVKRLDGSGNVVTTYTPAETAIAHDLDKVEVTGDLQYLWVSDQLSSSLFKFELGDGMARSVGVQVGTVETMLPVGQLCGFITVDGYRPGTAYSTVTTEEQEGVIPTPHVCECKSTPDSPNIGETPLPEPIVQFVEQCDGDGIVPSGDLGTLGDDNWAL